MKSSSEFLTDTKLIYTRCAALTSELSMPSLSDSIDWSLFLYYLRYSTPVQIKLWSKFVRTNFTICLCNLISFSIIVCLQVLWKIELFLIISEFMAALCTPTLILLCTIESRKYSVQLFSRVCLLFMLILKLNMSLIRKKVKYLLNP